MLEESLFYTVIKLTSHIQPTRRHYFRPRFGVYYGNLGRAIILTDIYSKSSCRGSPYSRCHDGIGPDRRCVISSGVLITISRIESSSGDALMRHSRHIFPFY